MVPCWTHPSLASLRHGIVAELHWFSTFQTVNILWPGSHPSIGHLLNSYICTSVIIFITKLLEQTVICNLSVYKVVENINCTTLLIAVLYYINHPYYPNRNKGIDLFVVSIITIVTGIYDCRLRVFQLENLVAFGKRAARNGGDDTGWYIGLAIKWSRTLSLSGIDKIRNHLIARSIHCSEDYDTVRLLISPEVETLLASNGRDRWKSHSDCNSEIFFPSFT